MPVITFEYGDLVSLLGETVPVDVLLSRIPMMGADLHSYDPTTKNISVEFFPDRPDLYSVEGTARALRAFLGINPGLQTYPVTNSGITLHCDDSVREVRPFIVASAVKDVTMSDPLIRSLMELQEKLHLTMGRKRAKVSIGVHDLDTVKPPFVYKAVDPESVSFVPLAKEEEMNLREILQRHEKGVAYANILEGMKRYPLLVDKNNEVLSFPPIINGRLTTVTDATSNVFVDVTGTDLNAISGALNIVVTAMAERGAKIESVQITGAENKVTPDLEPRPWHLSNNKSNSWLGLNLGGQETVVCLERMGFGCQVHGQEIDVLAPSTRLDLLHPVDLMEDVAKGYGYERFGNTLPRIQTIGKERPIERAADLLRQIMIGYGFLEVTTLILSCEADQFQRIRTQGSPDVRILNPISEEHTCLRSQLIPSLLSVLRKSKHRDLPQKIFEVGDVVMKKNRRKHLAGAYIAAKASFTEMKSIVEGLLRDSSVPASIEALNLGTYIEGRAASILIEGESIGHFGELSPEVITSYDLGYPLAAFELDVEKLLSGKLDRMV